MQTISNEPPNILDMGADFKYKYNVAENRYYEKLMRNAKANITQAYMEYFSVSDSTFYKRMRTREFSPAEKKFFREYVAMQGLNLDDFEDVPEANRTQEPTAA